MIILIDDDKIVYLGWKLKASKAGLELSHYYSVEEFMMSSSSIDHNCTIYIDSELGKGIRGEQEAKKIYDIGFHRIFLVTGHNKTEYNLDNLPWLKDILGKSPPF